MAWNQTGKIDSPSVVDGYAFGEAVAVSGDGKVMAVGADGGVPNTYIGRVHIYDNVGGTWVSRGTALLAGDGASYDDFGFDLALSYNGSVLVVGAYGWEGTLANRGGVYTFDWSGSAWVQRGAVLTTADGATNDNFGYSVDLSADGLVMVVGARLWENSGFTDQGGVYTFDWSGSAWVQRGTVLTVQYLYGSFGTSVALSGNGSVLAVAQEDWGGAVTSQWGVRVFDWSGSAWVQRGAVLSSPYPVASDGFGKGLDLAEAGDTLAILQPRTISTMLVNRVFVYDWIGGAWVLRDGDGFVVGVSSGPFFNDVCVSGSGLYAGTGSEVIGGITAGAVYVFAAISPIFWTNLNGQREVI